MRGEVWIGERARKTRRGSNARSRDLADGRDLNGNASEGGEGEGGVEKAASSR